MDPTPTPPGDVAAAAPSAPSAPSAPVASASAGYGKLAPPSKIVAADLQVLEGLQSNLALVKQALEVAWSDPKRGGFHVFTVILYLEQVWSSVQIDDLRQWMAELSARQAAATPPSTPPSSPSPARSPASPSTPAKHADNRRVDARALRTALGLTLPTSFITGPIDADFRTLWRQIKSAVAAREYNPPQAWEMCTLVFTGSAFAALEKAMVQHYRVTPDQIFEHLRLATSQFDWAAIEELAVDYFNGPNFVCNIVTKLRSRGADPAQTLDLFEASMRGIDQVTSGHQPQWYIDLNDQLTDAAARQDLGDLLRRSEELARTHCDLVTKYQTMVTAMLLENMSESRRLQFFSEAALQLDSLPRRHDRWAKMYNLDLAIVRLRREIALAPAHAAATPVPLPDPVPVMPAIARPARSAGKPVKYRDGAGETTPPRRRFTSEGDDSASGSYHTRKGRTGRGQPGSAKPGGQQKK